MSAATGRVDDQGFELPALVHASVGVPQALGAFQVAVVREQRTAALLVMREPHLASRELEQRHRGVMRLRIQDRHHATDKKCDAMLSLAERGRDVPVRRLKSWPQPGQHASGS